LLAHFWYGSIFLINVPLVAVVACAVLLEVPESRSPRARRVDLGGLALGTAGVTLLTWGIIEGPSWGWRTGATLGVFAGALVALVSFVFYELRREGPLLDVRVFRNRTFSAGAGSIAANFFCLFGFIFLITQYFQLVRGYSALSAGVHTLPYAAVVMIVTPLGAIASLRLGARRVVTSGLVILAGALVWVSTISATAAYFGPVLGAMVVLALGFSLVNAPSTASLMATLTPEQVGAGSAVNETTRELAGTFGVAVIGSVFSSLFGPGVRAALAPYVGHGLTSHELGVAVSSTQAARATVAHFPLSLQPGLQAHVTSAFMAGLHRGCLVAAAVALVVAILASTRLPGVTSKNDAPEPSPATLDVA